MQRPAHAHTLETADIVFETRSVTPEEVAAVTAVLVSAAGEGADAARVAAASGPDGWARSARSVRMPLEPGPGQWQRNHP
jgi:hypothetical protein